MLLRYEYFSEIKNQEETHLGSCTYWMYSDDPDPQMYTKIKYLMALSSVKMRREFKTLSCYSTYPSTNYYSGPLSPYYSIQYNERLRVVPLDGQVRFTGKVENCVIQYPSESEILSHIDQKIFDENDHWLEENFKGSRCYLNVWIGDKTESLDGELDESMFNDPGSDDNLAASMAVQDIQVEGNMDSSDSDFEEEFDLMGGLLPGYSYKSCQVSSEFLVFAEDYYRKKIILNSLIHKCIESGAIRSSRRKGYLLSKELKGVIYDRTLIGKIEQISSNIYAEFSHKFDTDLNQWLLLGIKALTPHNTVDLLENSSCFLRHDNRIIFSRKPIGKQASKQEILSELRSSLSVNL